MRHQPSAQYCRFQNNWDFIHGFQLFSSSKLVLKSVGNRWTSPNDFAIGNKRNTLFAVKETNIGTGTTVQIHKNQVYTCLFVPCMHPILTMLYKDIQKSRVYACLFCVCIKYLPCCSCLTLLSGFYVRACVCVYVCTYFSYADAICHMDFMCAYMHENANTYINAYIHAHVSRHLPLPLCSQSITKINVHMHHDASCTYILVMHVSLHA